MREVQVGLGNSQGGVEVEDMLCTLGGGEVKGRSGPMSWSEGREGGGLGLQGRTGARGEGAKGIPPPEGSNCSRPGVPSARPWTTLGATWEPAGETRTPGAVYRGSRRTRRSGWRTMTAATWLRSRC